ncbi:hypothetical protein H0H81_002810 [Sphagnurus paluster]|uniref:Aldose 1-epimerase n=1 Tax=Sphagnurus paluster TaxID=117069 RepID=A0A9P7GPC2_9AGAR|nr:hypothetical protein H0H81_002810 [Sphagnurus paluster]
MSEYQPVLLTLPSLTPSLALEILPHGLTLHRIIVQADGRTHDIVIGPESPKDHSTQKYTNSIIGRYTNRIPVGNYVLERNGVKCNFNALANENPRVSLHGGPTGFDTASWTLLTPENPATLFSEAELAHLSSPTAAHVIFRLVSPDGDQGYPGKLIVEALVVLIGPGEQERKYRLPDEAPRAASPEYDLGSIVLIYRAKLDEEGKQVVTPVNLTQAHDYYMFRSSEAQQIPTRIPLSSFDSKLDLIKDVLQPCNDAEGNPNRGNRPEPVVEISSDKSGIKLLFDTNQSGVMFYANGLANPSSGARKKIHGGSGISGHGDSYTPGTAAFLEFHDPLAAFLDSKNRDGNDTLITTAELYHNYVRCDVRFKEVADDPIESITEP